MLYKKIKILLLILIISEISILSTFFPVYSQNEELFFIPPAIDSEKDVTSFEKKWKLRLGLGWDGYTEKRNIDLTPSETESDGAKFDIFYSIDKEFNKKANLIFNNSTYYTAREINSISYFGYKYAFNPRYSFDFGFNYEYLDDYTETEWDYSRANTMIGFTYTPNSRFRMSFKNWAESWRYRLEDPLRPDRERNTFVWDIDYCVDNFWSNFALSFVNDDFDDDATRNSFEKRFTLNMDYRISTWTRIEIDEEYEQLQYGRGDYEDDVRENDFSVAFWHSFGSRVDMEFRVKAENQNFDNEDTINFDNHTDWLLPKIRLNLTEATYLEGGTKYGEREYLDRNADNSIDLQNAWLLDYEQRENFLRLGYTRPKIWTGIEGSLGQREMTNGETRENPDYDSTTMKAWLTWFFTPELNLEFFYDYTKRENYTFKDYDEELHNANFKLNWSVH